MKRFKFFYWMFIFSSVFLYAEEDSLHHEFSGNHLFASYSDCDVEAMSNVDRIRAVMKEATKISGATELDSCEYVFSPQGFTMVILLSESHASIHTYPEMNSCFIDIFTCGQNCSPVEFEKVLRAYFCPKKVTCNYFSRKSEVKELILAE